MPDHCSFIVTKGQQVVRHLFTVGEEISQPGFRMNIILVHLLFAILPKLLFSFPLFYPHNNFVRLRVRDLATDLCPVVLDPNQLS